MTWSYKNILFAQFGNDWLFGYGLKFNDNLKNTHLGRIGEKQTQAFTNFVRMEELRAYIRKRLYQKMTSMVIKVDSEIELKQLERSDASDIFDTINNQREYLGKWLPFVAFTQKVSDTEKFVDAVINAAEDRFEYVFTINKNEVFVGLIGFKDTDRQNNKTEIGYWLSEKYQRQGIVTKSVDKLCGFAFNQLGMNRIQIKCAVENLSSKNIPKKLGFKLEGIERQGELLSGGFYTDLEIYSKLKVEHGCMKVMV